MAYYVRRIARAKWSLLDQNTDAIIENYKADALANDLRTKDNTLSFWKVESLDQEDIEPAIVINSLATDNIRTLNLLCVPDKLLSKYSMVPTDGDTVVHKYRKLHYNLSYLSVGKLVEFARDVVLPILQSEDLSREYLKKYNEKYQFGLIEAWLAEKQFCFDELKDTQQKDIEEHRKKQKKS